MTVREHGEIKGIKGIAVQENGVTQVSSADTVNIVGGGTVTDTGGVATINIPQGVTWYREDVTAGSATYTFVHSPATSTSFLIFTDSGTLLFSGIDYTYDPDTETVTFLSLGANEAAYIWNAHATVQGGGIGDMVKAVYDPTNINASAFDYNNFINTPTIGNATLTIQKNGSNVSTFTANATSNVTANIVVPTKVSELTNDTGFITSTSIPTKVSQLTNDTGFVTNQVSDGAYGSSWDGDTTHAPSKNAIYDKIETITGNSVSGPASSTDGHIAVFDGATGKLLKDSGLKIQTTTTIPSGASICDVYYDDGTIYIYTQAVRDNIILES